VIRPADIDERRPVVIASKFVKDIVAGLRRAGYGRPPVPHYLLPILLPGQFPGGYHTLSAETIAAGRRGIEETLARLADEPSRTLFLQLLRFRLTLDPLDLPDPTPDQYFPAGFWRLDGHEVFVDVGACEGDTLVDFLRRTHGHFDRYFAVEPDPRNLLGLRRLVEGLADPRMVVAPCAAGERSEVLSFVEGRGGESHMGTEGAVRVEVVPLDKLLAGERVTTIKVDVEGFERQTLKGARQIIGGLGPKLALSVYHLLPDLWEIPEAVAACRSDYRYYLRHHTAEIYDTVLYCVGEDDGPAPHAESGLP
jgi:FkbM family methyltransferase